MQLQKFLSDHRTWANKRQGSNPGTPAYWEGRPTLCSADLSEHDLTKAYLEEADLKGADLHKVNLKLI